MRTTILLLVGAVLAVVVLAACRPRDDAADDSSGADTAHPDDTGRVADTVMSDSASLTTSPTRSHRPKVRPTIRSATDSGSDSTADDTARALRPEMPQVTPEKRPRTWRGFKLPEAMPVRAPVETIKLVEPAPDSVMKGDSTPPPRPAR